MIKTKNNDFFVAYEDTWEILKGFSSIRAAKAYIKKLLSFDRSHRRESGYNSYIVLFKDFDGFLEPIF